MRSLCAARMPCSIAVPLDLIRTGGDACILAAAFFYSLATVRLSRLAANVSSLELAASKSLALAIISLGWIGISAANQVAF